MISDTKQEPTQEYLAELLSHVQTTWSNREQGTLDQERLTMYWDEDLVPQEDTAAKGRRRRIQPERMTANELRREVDLILGLFPYPAEIGVQWIGEGSRSESKAENVERGLNEAIDQLNPPLDAPLLRERWQMCLLGRSARLIVPGHMYWWDFPYINADESLDDWQKRYGQWQSQAPIPVCWVDLPAESTFPASFGRMDEELISWQMVNGYDLCQMFSPEELGKITRGDFYQTDLNTIYTLSIFSNQAYLAYGISTRGGETLGQNDLMGTIDCLIRVEEHGLGVPAIQICPGATSGRKEPGKYWQGVADSSISLIKAANRRLSEAATASKFDALPVFKAWIRQSLTEEGSNQDTSQYFQGDIWELQTANSEGEEKEDIEPLFNPRFAEKSMAMGQFALQRAERNSGAVEALEGGAGPSGEPAWSRNSIIEQSKMKHSRLSQAVSASDVAAADMISRCIISFGEDVNITTKGAKGPAIILKPEELKKYKMVLKSEYKMKLPVSRRADMQLMVSMMQQAKEAGLPISPAWIMENVGDITRPLEEFKRSVTWQLLMSDESMAYYKKLLVQESEQDLSTEEGMQLVEMMDLVASGQLPPEAAQQLGQLATGQSGGRTTSRMARGGVPFSTNPTGPQPEQELPPVGALQ